MADIELLPLPEWVKCDDLDGLTPEEVRAEMRHYARANLIPLQAKNERLREALAALKAENETLRTALKDADNELDWLDEEIDTCDHSVGVCTCSYWNMRRNMKAALSKGNNND